MGVVTHHGNAIKWARRRARESGPVFHALFCDAPYEMDFMGNDWDSSGVAFDPDTWEAFAGVLYPGGFLFVCAGTINDDLISVAMRKAGLRKFHKVMGWAYGSGFPKASRIDYSKDTEWLSAFVDIPGEVFSGHRYGLQALKPAIETILVFQKPYNGKPIDNITETGAGALNIEGGRIGIEEDLPRYTPSKSGLGKHGIYAPSTREQGANSPTRYDSGGRWPSNLLLLDEGAARALDEQSGERPAGNGKPIRAGDFGKSGIYNNTARGAITQSYSDSGGASRFFFQVSEQIDEADPVFYSAKASRGEREAGLGETGLKESSQRYGLTGSTEETGHGPHKHHKNYNSHPTVKPLSLCKYLATLLLPPVEYAPRRLFVPFAGVGSEQIGAHLAGWEEIEGVELTKEYIPINEARVKYWQKRGDISRKPKNSLPANVKNPNQMELI